MPPQRTNPKASEDLTMPTPPRFTLDQLAVLDAIARSGSFAGAARELHRVPSAISYTVAALEEALGVAVFDRSGHRASLSPAGQKLLDEARDLLQRAAQLDQLAAVLGEGWEPDLRVVIDGALALGPLLRTVAELTRRAIPTRVHIDVEYQDGVIERFEAGADLALALGLEDGGRFKGVPLPPLNMVLVAAAAHPLASAQELSRDSLAEHVDLVVKDSSSAFARSPRPSFLGTRHVIRFSDFHSKREAILAGIGYGWLPLHLAAEDLDRGALRLLELPDGNRWSYTPQLLTRRDSPPGPAAALFAEVLLAELQKN